MSRTIPLSESEYLRISRTQNCHATSGIDPAKVDQLTRGITFISWFSSSSFLVPPTKAYNPPIFRHREQVNCEPNMPSYHWHPHSHSTSTRVPHTAIASSLTIGSCHGPTSRRLCAPGPSRTPACPARRPRYCRRAYRN